MVQVFIWLCKKCNAENTTEVPNSCWSYCCKCTNCKDFKMFKKLKSRLNNLNERANKSQFAGMKSHSKLKSKYMVEGRRI